MARPGPLRGAAPPLQPATRLRGDREQPGARGSDPFFSVDSDHGYRAARIEDLIEDSDGHSVSSAQAMQMDNRDGGAGNLMPHLLRVESQNDTVLAMQEVLTPWSEGDEPFQSAPTSPGAAAYQATWVHLLALTFHDELPEDSWPEGGSRWFEVVARLLESPDDPWWDDVSTSEVEGRDAILEQAMADAHAELTERLGDDPESWEWGQLHRASFEIRPSASPDRAYRVGLQPDAHLASAAGPIWSRGRLHPPVGYDVDWVPSMRTVVDLADMSASTVIHTTGQSGHAFHAQYEDMIDDWADGAQRPLRWTREQVDADAAGTLVLTPAPWVRPAPPPPACR